MTLHDRVAALRAASAASGERAIAVEPADMVNHVAASTQRSVNALWDALQTIAQTLDEHLIEEPQSRD